LPAGGRHQPGHARIRDPRWGRRDAVRRRRRRAHLQGHDGEHQGVRQGARGGRAVSARAIPPQGNNMMSSRLLVALLAPVWMMAVPARAADAPDQNLRIAHHVLSIGKDGVQRETRYADRMYRREGAVWIEREMPTALRTDDESRESKAQAPAGHAHDGAI